MNNGVIIPVEVKYNLGKFEDNLAAVKESIVDYCGQFTGLVVTEETIAESKKIVADIRKKKKDLDDDRKAIKKAWMAPFEAFEKRAKDLIAVYDMPIEAINKQLSEHEQNRISAKREEIRTAFNSLPVPESIVGWLNLADIFNPKWDNVTYSIEKIKAEITDEYTALSMAAASIRTMNHPFEIDGIGELKRTRSLTKALEYMSELKRMDDLIKQRQIEEERRKESQKKEEEKPVSETEKPAAAEAVKTDDDLPFGLPGEEEPMIVEYVVAVPAESSKEFENMMQKCGFNYYRKGI